MLVAISNVPRDYAWGSTTLLAELEDRVPATVPEAEVWFGDHPADPADLEGGGDLSDVTGGTLPYLLKLLAAANPLSIQVHPTREQAATGFAREAGLAPDDPSRNYRDDNHKPELLVALRDGFRALGGLRPLADTRRLLMAFGDNPAASQLRAWLEVDPVGEVIRRLLEGRADAIVEGVVAGLTQARSEEFAAELETARDIAARNPGDAGVVVALLMNLIELRRGEAIFLRAGLLHAYVSGIGVEIMAASDNVLRGGLTSKHIDVTELLSVLDPTPGPVPVMRPQPDAADAWYPVPVEDFALRRIRVDGSITVSVAGPCIVLATAGDVRVQAGTGGLVVPVGRAVFASAEESVLVLSGSGEAFLAQPGTTAEAPRHAEDSQ